MLVIVGLGLHLYNAGEVLTALAVSGIVILLLGLVMLSGFLAWQASNRFLAWIASWSSAEPPCRPLKPRDFAVRHVHELPIVGQTR